jgi:two-component system, response regulator YesN
VLIEFNSDFFGKYEFDFDKVVQIIKEEWESLYLNLNPQQSVILLKIPEEEAAKADNNYRIEHFLSELHDYIYEKSRQFMYAAVSDVFSDYHKLSGVMDELEALMNNKFYQMDKLSTFLANCTIIYMKRADSLCMRLYLMCLVIIISFLVLWMSWKHL